MGCFHAKASAQELSVEIGEITKALLWDSYPDALVHQPGTFSGYVEPNQVPDFTVRHVLGSPMNAGDTPEEAAADWLEEWGEVFGVLDYELESQWEITLPEREEWSIVKTVHRYTQVMGELPVSGSDVRIMTAREKNVQAGSEDSERVISVQALLLPAPELGLEPTLTPQQILVIAEDLRPEYTSWTEPLPLVAAKVPGYAVYGSHLGYVVTGSSAEHDPELLLIDGHTGDLVRFGPANPSCGFAHGGKGSACSEPGHNHAVMNGENPTRGAGEVALQSETADAPSSLAQEPKVDGTIETISGTVYAWRTPDWWSDTRFISDPTNCLRNPAKYEQAEVRVEVWNTGGTVLYDTEYTDSDGDYTVTCPSPGNYLVRATLGGLNWDVVHFSNQTYGCATTPASDPDPVSLELASVATGTTTADMYFAGTISTASGSAQPIADTNVHEAVRICMAYWRSIVPGNSPLNAHFLAWTNEFGAGAFFTVTGGTVGGATWTCDDVLRFQSGAIGYTVHYGSGTIAAHEFGHLVSQRLGLVVLGGGGLDFPAFAEGYSDATTGVLLPDAAGSTPPTTIGPDTEGDACGADIRAPQDCNPQFPICYPGCHTGGAYCGITNHYAQAKLLGALWMDTRSELGYPHTRGLFSTWTLIATPPGVAMTECACSNTPSLCSPPPCLWDESAGSGTLHEVLIADDNDDDLGNGTPNDDCLCFIYAARSIFLDIDIPACDTPACEESASGAAGCAPDIDCSGSCDIFDLLTFANMFHAGDLRSDINGDGLLRVDDWSKLVDLMSSAPQGPHE